MLTTDTHAQLKVRTFTPETHRDDNVHTFSNTPCVKSYYLKVQRDWNVNSTEASAVCLLSFKPAAPHYFHFLALLYLCSPKKFKITKPMNGRIYIDNPLFSWSEVSGWYRTQAQSRSGFIVFLSALQQSGNLNLGPRLWKRSAFRSDHCANIMKADQLLIRAEQSRNSGAKISSAEVLTLWSLE